MIEAMRRDWLLTGLSIVAALTIFIGVDMAIVIQATAAGSQIQHID